MPRYACGLEFSTQSTSVLLLDIDTGKIPYKRSFNHDEKFGHLYNIHQGVLRSDTSEKCTPQALLTNSLNLVFESIPAEYRRNIVVWKADAMQHALTYSKDLGSALEEMDPRTNLSGALDPSFTRTSSPMWMDRTTTEQAARLDAEFSHPSIRAITGNPSELRFPAAQLMKWIGQDRTTYEDTTDILPLSAYLTSILRGRVSPTDTGDGWGTNLNTLDIAQPGWDHRIMGFIDRDLEGKFADMVPYDTELGTLNPYLADRFGYNADAIVLAGTGDNPSYLLDFFLSVGTSWTLNGTLPEVRESNGEDNVFGAKNGKVMSLVCFTNGANVHESFKAAYQAGSWEAYQDLARQGGKGSHIMLPYLAAESVPRRPAGIQRKGFDGTDAITNVRALYDSQVLAAKLHSDHMDIPDSLWVVGGAGEDPILLQTVADVFDRQVQTLEESRLAAVLGNAIAGARHVTNTGYDVAIGKYAKPLEGSQTEPKDHHVYVEALEEYRELETSFAE